MKFIIAVAMCLAVAAATDARDKRGVVLGAPAIASPLIASHGVYGAPVLARSPYVAHGYAAPGLVAHGYAAPGLVAHGYAAPAYAPRILAPGLVY